MTNVVFKPSDELKDKADKVFEEQKERILKSIPNADVHHVGSTAISNSVTKGDLDVNVRVEKKDFANAIKQLKLLYAINQPENWTSDFASFKDEKNFAIEVGVQLTIKGSVVDDFVLVRDMLVNSPKLLEAYNKMKKEYEGKDMSEYRKGKAEFFERLKERKP